MNFIALLAVLLAVPVIAVSGCTSSQSPDASQTPVAPAGSEGNVVKMSASGFSPNALTIKPGETVTFINTDSGAHWPASDVHPLHTEYPGSVIIKCNSGEQIFDACHGLEPGEKWQFTFQEKGAWSYHDHLNPWMSGKIVVE